MSSRSTKFEAFVMVETQEILKPVFSERAIFLVYFERKFCVQIVFLTIHIFQFNLKNELIL